MLDFQTNSFNLSFYFVTLLAFRDINSLSIQPCLTNYFKSMFEEKAGELAGKIWEALNEGGELTGKEIKKAIKTRSDKDLFLGLGWLLREGKLNVTEGEKEISVSLK